MAIEANNVNKLDSLITDITASCDRIKEIDGSIARLKKKIEEIEQDDSKLAYYEYSCSEFKEEKNRIAKSFQESFKEIRKYDEELHKNYERLQMRVEIGQIGISYVARSLKDNSNFNWFEKRRVHAEMEERLKKIVKERDEVALKMEKTSPIVNTIKFLLTE